MEQEEFENVVDNQLNRVREVLVLKGREYAGNDTDRLQAFKTSADLQRINPAQALAGYMAKHTISIYEMINSGKEYSISQWEEKIGDHINYLLLLKALIVEAATDD